MDWLTPFISAVKKPPKDYDYTENNKNNPFYEPYIDIRRNTVSQFNSSIMWLTHMVLYAGIPNRIIPQSISLERLMADLKTNGFPSVKSGVENGLPKVGDLIFFCQQGSKQLMRLAVVADIADRKMILIGPNNNGLVQRSNMMINARAYSFRVSPDYTLPYRIHDAYDERHIREEHRQDVVAYLKNIYDIDVKKPSGENLRRALIKAWQIEFNNRFSTLPGKSSIPVTGVFGKLSFRQSGLIGQDLFTVQHDMFRIIKALLYCHNYSPRGLTDIYDEWLPVILASFAEKRKINYQKTEDGEPIPTLLFTSDIWESLMNKWY